MVFKIWWNHWIFRSFDRDMVIIIHTLYAHHRAKCYGGHKFMINMNQSSFLFQEKYIATIIYHDSIVLFIFFRKLGYN